MGEDEKVIENKLRRVAKRQGCHVRKSRPRDPLAWDYGVYYVIDSNRNFLVQELRTRDQVLAYVNG